MQNSVELESAAFVVLDRPVCVWDPSLSGTNLRFLRGLDPTYFKHQAQAYYDALSPPDQRSIANAQDRFAAIALRVKFGMALESMFAVLGAVIQAPHCVFGWLSEYKNDELAQLVSRISEQKPVRALHPFRPVTWETISRQLLLPLLQTHPELYERATRRFAEAWQHLAEFYTTPIRSREYNILKHSFRTAPAGINIEFKIGEETFFKSECAIGHTFPYLQKNPGQKSNFSVSFASVALEPEMYAAGAHIAALTINNAAMFARAKVGDDQELNFLVPESDTQFDLVTKHHSSIQAMTHGGKSIPATYLSEQDIFAQYDEA